MWALVSTAFFMGLLGGAHCLVMCAVPCGAVIHPAQPANAAQPMHWVGRRRFVWRSVIFHLGRIAGYSFVGALVAYAMGFLAGFGQGTSALKPLWTVAHLLIVAWGLMMLFKLHQPAWMEQAGKKLWSRIQRLIAAPGGLFGVGCAWAFLPCGFLYSAFLVAALSGGPIEGALTMLVFALGSGIWLWTSSVAWIGLKRRIRNPQWTDWGIRLSGVVLMVLGSIALWWGVVHQEAAPWCLP